FLQLLEGEKEMVHRLFSLIESDPRHKNIEVIQTEEKAERLFNKWSMAFYDYGNLALSAQIKLAQIDTFFEDSQALKTQSRLTNPFFNEVRNMLIEKAI
ncbi:MAG: BLUF domain-containing protein, partial [Flavobacteriaceae bacterium]